MGFFATLGIRAAHVEGARSRVVSAGVDPHQYAAVTGAIDDLRDWPSAFMATATEYLRRAEAAQSAGATITAGESYRQAALWFHFATTLPIEPPVEPPDQPTAHALAAHALRQSLALLDPTAERIDGDGFAGILRRPARIEPHLGHPVDPPPLALIIAGMDSSKVEFVSIADALLRRGVAVLAFDGPGQGELTPTSPPTPAYHAVTSRVIDAVAGRADVDIDRGVGIVALSLGGFYGATSMAHESRIRAGVVVSGPDALRWDELPPFVTETLVLRTGSASAAREFADRIDLDRVDGSGENLKVAERISQPLLVVDGGQDRIPGTINGQRLAERAPRGEFLLVDEGDHLLGNCRWRWLPDALDWLADRLR
ncbi:MAG: alpha/beta fold hydrolase [Sciscionella sp.]|nr:alpha/beta fold hydrolase [Sciscionella sp.]